MAGDHTAGREGVPNATQASGTGNDSVEARDEASTAGDRTCMASNAMLDEERVDGDIRADGAIEADVEAVSEASVSHNFQDAMPSSYFSFPPITGQGANDM